MKTNILKNIIRPLAIASVTLVLCSCSKWDEFKGYIADGEISYTGKIDSVKVYSGNERVRILGLLKADPKITTVKVFWDDYADSAEYTVDTSSGNRVFDETLNVTEGIKSFVLYTYDADGNNSVPVNAVGRAYGPRYQSGLRNRVVSGAISTNDTTWINWVPMDLSAGPIATEIRYLSTSGEKAVRVPIDSARSYLDDLHPTAKTFSYRTLFLPQEAAIDTFYTDFATVGIARDVTAEYLKNTQVPIETSARSDRWGIPAHWATNDAVRNFRDGAGNYFGGVDYWFGGPFLAMEAGWSADNMATITNGKIYQTVTLPAGIYTFEMEIPDCTPDAEFYTVSAEGDEIPDIEDLNVSLTFLKTSTPGAHKITFTLTETEKVSLGFVGHLPNKGAGDGTFWRITRVKLQQQVLVD